jgi:hypothetical protein
MALSRSLRKSELGIDSDFRSLRKSESGVDSNFRSLRKSLKYVSSECFGVVIPFIYFSSLIHAVSRKTYTFMVRKLDTRYEGEIGNNYQKN